MSGATQAPLRSDGRSAVSRLMTSRSMLLFAFAFAVMADPVSSVAYAIEAALRALNGNLTLLLPTMALVIAIVVLIIINYQQVVARYPQGGGAAAATGEAFGEGAAFVPLGALIVDFVLTIAISASAGASAIIAVLPGLASWRVPIAVILIVAVACVCWFGHLGRALFAVMAVAFIGVAVAVLVFGFFVDPHGESVPPADPGHSPLLAVALAFPVAMALATGIEAPSSAIAQLGQLDDRGRGRFGKITLWLTLGVVGTLTLGLTAQAVRLNVGIPAEDTTQVAELARLAAPGPVFALFQLVTALLLLAAASSSFQAGPGLLKALARRHGTGTGILPRWLGATNHHHTPYWGVVVFAGAAALVTMVAGGRDQELVLFYAASVFVSFLAGLVAMSRFSLRERHARGAVVNILGALVVTFTLAVNLTRGDPIISIGASLLIAAGLHWLWIRSGRPRGVQNAAAEAEQQD